MNRLFLITLMLAVSLASQPHAAEPPEKDTFLPEPVAVEIVDTAAQGGMTYADVNTTA